jgi:hypothetical protein
VEREGSKVSTPHPNTYSRLAGRFLGGVSQFEAYVVRSRACAARPDPSSTNALPLDPAEALTGERIARGASESSPNTRASGSGRLRRPPSQPAQRHMGICWRGGWEATYRHVSVGAGRFYESDRQGRACALRTAEATGPWRSAPKFGMTKRVGASGRVQSSFPSVSSVGLSGSAWTMQAGGSRRANHGSI